MSWQNMWQFIFVTSLSNKRSSPGGTARFDDGHKNDANPRSCKSGKISWLGFLSGQRLCLRLSSPWLLLASQCGIRLIRSKGTKNHRECEDFGSFWAGHFCFEGAYIRSIGMVQLLFVFYSIQFGVFVLIFCLVAFAFIFIFHFFAFLLLRFPASSLFRFFFFHLLFCFSASPLIFNHLLKP